MAVNIEPGKAYDAYQDWVVKSIVDTDQRHFSLGQFFFGVSSGTIGSFIAIYKLTAEIPNYIDWIGLGVLTISTLFALRMVIPRELMVDSKSDLQRMHTKLVNKNTNNIYQWVCTWGGGVIFTTFGLFN